VGKQIRQERKTIRKNHFVVSAICSQHPLNQTNVFDNCAAAAGDVILDLSGGNGIRAEVKRLKIDAFYFRLPLGHATGSNCCGYLPGCLGHIIDPDTFPTETTDVEPGVLFNQPTAPLK
jgi:hypothetical protein